MREASWRNLAHPEARPTGITIGTMDTSAFIAADPQAGTDNGGPVVGSSRRARQQSRVDASDQRLERKGFITPWQSGKVLKGDIDGFFLGGYRLLYKIASGSFGRVFRADDPRSGRVVAVKVLRGAGARTSSASTCSSAKARSA